MTNPDDIELLDPWWSTKHQSEEFHRSVVKQLKREIPRGHALEKVDVRVIARGNGDDALFQLLDGSGRVATVHLTWQRSRQKPPWPLTDLFESLEEWRVKVMLPDHEEWSGQDE